MTAAMPGTAIFLHIRHHGPVATARILSVLPASWQRVVLTAPALAEAVEPVPGATVLPLAEAWDGTVPDLPALIRARCDPAIERVILGCDDGLLVLPETLPALGDASVGVFGCDDGATTPLYALSNFSRPDDYLAGGVVDRAALDLLDAITPFRFDRWLGHRLALAALHRGRQTVLIKSGFALLPSPFQCSGANVGLTRMRARPVIEEALAARPGLAMGEAWYDGARRAIGHVPRVAEATLGIGTASDLLKSEIDETISALTATIFERLPVMADGGTEPSPPRRLAFLGIETIDDAVPLLALMRIAREEGVRDIRLHGMLEVLDGLRDCPYIDATLPAVDVISEAHRLFLAQHPEQILERQLPGLIDFLTGVDTVIVPSRDVERMNVAALAKLAGVKRRIGFSETGSTVKWARNRGFDGCLTDVVQVGGDPIAKLAEILRWDRHVPDLAQAVTGSSSSGDEAAIHAWLDAPALRDGPLLVLAPGAGWARRRWTVENFGILAEEAVWRWRARIIVVGHGADTTRAGAALARRLGEGVLNLTGKANLARIFHLLKAADLCIASQNYVSDMAPVADCASIVVSCHPIGGPEDHPDNPPHATGRIVIRPQSAVATGCRAGCRSTIWPHCIVQIGPDRILSEIQALLSRQSADETVRQ
jgi:ADP-heptose:LPS heptosyltransferase